MTLKEKQDELVELFEAMGDWETCFQYLYDLSQRAESFLYPKNFMTSEYQIAGCQSRTYLYLQVENDTVHIKGWSNAAIPGGLVAILEDLFEGCSLQDLRGTEIDFHQRTGLIDQLTLQRKEVLLNMIDRLKQL